MTDDYEILQRLHNRFHPLMRSAVGWIHRELGELIEKRRKLGWRTELNVRLDRALQRFAGRFERVPDEVLEQFQGVEMHEIEQRTSIIPDLHEEVCTACDLIMCLAELETVHFPRWFEWLVGELKAEKLIE